MRRDKALLPLGGVTLLERTARLVAPLVEEVVVIGRSPDHCGPGWRVVADEVPGLGPLGGIATALGAAPQRAGWNLVVACDLPYLTAAWLDFLLTRAEVSPSDVVMAMNEGGPEPLCAAYHQRIAGAVRAAAAGGVRKVTDALAGARVEFIPPGEWKRFASGGPLFKNMNSPEDYAEAWARFGDE